MSKIDELIQELCPEGVPAVSLSAVATIGTGNSDKKDSDSEGPYPFFVRSKQIYRSSTLEFDETAILIPGEGGIGDIFHFHEGPYALHQRAYRVAPFSDKVDPKFLYYFMVSRFKEHIMARAVSATVSSIRKPMIESFPVAIPPLEIQREIVSILDKFTQLEAELEAELEARRVQYEVTRDRLLDFSGDLQGHPLGSRIRSLCPSGIQVNPLGDLVINRDSERRPVTRGLRRAGRFPYYGANGIQDYVDSYLFDGTFLLVGEDGSVMGIDGTPVLNWASGQIWVNNHAHVLQESAHGPSLRFLYFFLSTVEVSNFVTGGTQKKINQGNLNRIPVPVPPLEIQREIVSILDKLDALVNDITKGLPAEMAARRKQYEYYRNKLLTFKELETA